MENTSIALARRRREALKKGMWMAGKVAVKRIGEATPRFTKRGKGGVPPNAAYEGSK